MARPSTLPTWATTGGTTTEPSAGQKAAGFAVGTKPPAKWVNWLLKNLSEWATELDRQTTVFAYRNLRMVTADIGASPRCAAALGQDYWLVGGLDLGGSALLKYSPNGGFSWAGIANTVSVLNGMASNASLAIAVGDADGVDADIISMPLSLPSAPVATERANPKNFSLYGVAVNASGVWVACGAADGTDAYLLSSTDGTTWTERSNPTNATLRAVAHNGLAGASGLFVAVGDGYLITSNDGTTWVDHTPGGAGTLRAVAHNRKSSGGLWVTIDNSGRTYTSADGVTWVAGSVLFVGSAYCGVDYTGSAWVFRTQGGAYLSLDGTTWIDPEAPEMLLSSDMTCMAVNRVTRQALIGGQNLGGFPLVVSLRDGAAR